MGGSYIQLQASSKQTEEENTPTTKEEAMWRWSQRWELLSHKLGNTSKHQSLGEVRKDPALELLEEIWPCQHLDFKLLACRIWREKHSYGFKPQFVANCYSNPRKPIQYWKNKRFHPVFHAFSLIENYLKFLLLVILD